MHLNNVICARENVVTILYITVNFTVDLGFFLVRWQLSGDATLYCTTIHRYPIFSTRYSVMCTVYTGDCGTSEVEHCMCACTVDNPLAKARGLSLRTGAQTMLYLSLVIIQ